MKNKKVFTILKLIITTAILIHAANEFIRFVAKKLATLATSQDSHTYNWRLGDIFYTIKGFGSPLLLLHDLLPGASAQEWSKIEDTLAQNHTVYSIDLLGCGRSSKPNLVYTNFLYVQMINDFITNVIREKTEVIASGFSGSLAVMTALYNKEAIHSLTLINPVDPAELAKTPGQKEQWIRKLLETPLLGTMIYNISFCRSNVENDYTEKYYYNPFHLDQNIIDGYYEAAHKSGADGKFLYASLVTKYLHFNIIPALSKITIPVKLIFGAAESGHEKAAENYMAILSDAKTSCIDASRHYPHLEQPTEFLKCL